MVCHEKRRAEVVERVHRIEVVMVTLDDGSHVHATPLFDDGAVSVPQAFLVPWLWCHGR